MLVLENEVVLGICPEMAPGVIGLEVAAWIKVGLRKVGAP